MIRAWTSSACLRLLTPTLNLMNEICSSFVICACNLEILLKASFESEVNAAVKGVLTITISSFQLIYNLLFVFDCDCTLDRIHHCPCPSPGSTSSSSVLGSWESWKPRIVDELLFREVKPCSVEGLLCLHPLHSSSVTAARTGNQSAAAPCERAVGPAPARMNGLSEALYIAALFNDKFGNV